MKRQYWYPVFLKRPTYAELRERYPNARAETLDTYMRDRLKKYRHMLYENRKYYDPYFDMSVRKIQRFYKDRHALAQPVELPRNKKRKRVVFGK